MTYAAYGTPGGFGYIDPFNPGGSSSAPATPTTTSTSTSTASISPPGYTGPINDSINNTQQGADLVNANQAAAAKLGISIPGSTYTPPGVITPQSMTPTQPFPLVSPTPTPTYPVSSLQTPTPPITETPQEQKASGVTDTLKGLYSSLVGKSAYQTEQNTNFGVDTAQKSITDLGAKLTSLKNEAASIPLQLAGQAIPQAFITSQTNDRLRTNAIAALGVSTLLAASQGQLANAQALADKAVAQKYDPIQEEIDAAKQNLQLILNDPQTTVEDKNRAQAQLDIQNQKTQELATAKTNATEVWNVATTAAQNGKNFTPSGQYTDLSTTLHAISEAPTKEQALQIASSTGLLSSNTTTAVTPKILGSASTGYFQYDPATGKTTPISGSGGTSTGGYPSGYPTTQLQPGATGTDVTKLQNWLNSTQGASIPVTGTYDAATTAAVLTLQKKLGIDYSSGPGYFGPRTLAALGYTPKTTTTTSTTFGSLSKADQTKGINWIINNGGTTEDQQKFQTDRAFQAWVMQKAAGGTSSTASFQ